MVLQSLLAVYAAFGIVVVFGCALFAFFGPPQLYKTWPDIANRLRSRKQKLSR